MTKQDIGCSDSACGTNTAAALLNQMCYCTTLDRNRLNDILDADEVSQDLLITHPQLFSNIATFLSQKNVDQIAESISAIERVIGLSAFQKNALSQAHPNARHNAGAAGVFMGYDFHLDHDRPKLIEINTNAGGAFLNALLINAQIACCPPMETQYALEKETLYQEFVDMFLNEWRIQRGEKLLKRIAIVDAQPEKQFLYPEFKIAQKMFIDRGIDAVIAAPEQLSFEQNGLWYDGKLIDLVYNRLTDFALIEEVSQALNMAYQADAVVLTPTPYHHAIYANKKNLIMLSNKSVLQELGATESDINIITASVPVTCQVTLENAEDLWLRRKELFFKPVAGYGGKATYRGDKLTKRVWEEILKGEYIAQQQVAPSERGALLDNKHSSLKMDIRAYTYQGTIQLFAARLYQGQTTNFRTEGGGFSPVFIL